MNSSRFEAQNPRRPMETEFVWSVGLRAVLGEESNVDLSPLLPEKS